MRRFQVEMNSDGTWKVVRAADGVPATYEGLVLERLQFHEASALADILCEQSMLPSPPQQQAYESRAVHAPES